MTVVGADELRARRALTSYVRRRYFDELARQGRAMGRADVGAAVVALVAVAWSSWHALASGRALMFLDAQSHLTIARRIVDGPNAGLGQLGTVWLPLPHLLLAPFTAVLPLWRTGIAGAIVGALCAAVSCVALRRCAVRVTGNSAAGWVAVATFLSSASLRLIHATGFSEPVLLATTSMLLAGVSWWETNNWKPSGGQIVTYCGIPAFLVVLSRYEGWALVAVVALYAAVNVWFRHGLRAAIRAVRMFAVGPGAAVALWLLYNVSFFGDPLAFQRGAGSSEAQMAQKRATSGLPDEGHLGSSLRTFLGLAGGMCGKILLIVCLLSAIAYCAGVGPRMKSRVAFLAPALGLLHVVSLVAGQTFMSANYAVRYGVVMMPFVVLIAAWITSVVVEVFTLVSARVMSTSTRGQRIARRVAGDWALVCVVLLQLSTSSTVMLDAQGTIEHQQTRDTTAAARWIHSHYDGGQVLVDEERNPVLPALGLDLDFVVASFSGPRWDLSVPATLAQTDRAVDVDVDVAYAVQYPSMMRWALVDVAAGADGRNDRVAAMIRRQPMGWTVVYRSGTARVFRYDRLANR
jgi:hypothetical protein